jgi:predicted RNA-binding Zn ribbon-like protein
MVNSILQAWGAANHEEPLCVRFTNTVAWRRSSTRADEYLKTPDILRDWLLKQRLIGDKASIDESYRLRAIALRDAIYRIFSRLAAKKQIGEDDRDILNSELCEALGKIEIGQGLEWELSQTDEKDRAMMLIALSAAELLASPLRERVRECADDECGWLFLDHSKNRSRRWCSMSDCGNLAKARRFQQRKQAK